MISPMMSDTRCTAWRRSRSWSSRLGPASGAGPTRSTLAPIRRLDLAGGLGRTLGQAAHLAGHHREAAALLAGAGRFDRGVERQDVGLEGDAVDDAG